MKFPHTPPEGYEYWQDEFNKKLTRIWIKNVGMEFIYVMSLILVLCGGSMIIKKDALLLPSTTRNQGRW